ncbi:hypothetical protein D9613_003859 [Agrocybe pediades]|uniref:DUF6535 domain-containing protein n=1 Tax=Agrocybe pediades TaxID=84607 RepID=A0A8H4QKU7_9AGAR|nr:hypothetical protein D9613_003859 [Agrocybe pediades]
MTRTKSSVPRPTLTTTQLIPRSMSESDSRKKKGSSRASAHELSVWVPQHAETLQAPPRDVRRSSFSSSSGRSFGSGSRGSGSPMPESPFYASDSHTDVTSDIEVYSPGIKVASVHSSTDDLLNGATNKLQDECQQDGQARLWMVEDDFRHPIDLEPRQLKRKSSWEIVSERAWKDDISKCTIWKEEIDKLLVFAGLFAATVVAFIVVSYQLLLPAPDMMMKSLQHIAVSLVAECNLLNATCTLRSNTPVSSSPNAFKPSPAVLRMNISWFMAMTLSLCTVLIGTICLQWIREYQRNTRLGPKRALAVRQMRHDGFIEWKVPFICSLLPVLLQASLLLFFWGLLEFLWMLNTTLTVLVSIIIAAAVFFMVATIVAPAMQCIYADSDELHNYNQCAYKSPQALIFSVFAFTVAIFVIQICRAWRDEPEYLERKVEFLKKMRGETGWDWVSFDNQWQKSRIPNRQPDDAPQDSHDIPRALAWIGRHFVHDREAIFALCRLVFNSVHPYQALDVLRKISGKDDLVTGYDPAKDDSTEQIYEVLPDIQAALLLREMVQKNPDLQDAVMPHRAELFIRIFNYCSRQQEARGLDEEGLSQFLNGVQWNQLNPFMRRQDYALEMDLAVQFIGSFKKFLENDNFSKDSEFWKVVQNIVAQLISKKNEKLKLEVIQEMDHLNEVWLEYFRRNGLPEEQWDTLQNFIRKDPTDPTDPTNPTNPTNND